MVLPEYLVGETRIGAWIWQGLTLGEPDTAQLRSRLSRLVRLSMDWTGQRGGVVRLIDALEVDQEKAARLAPVFALDKKLEWPLLGLAVAVGKIRVAYWEAQGKEDFAKAGPNLAASINNLSVCLAEQGEHAAALTAAQRAVEICERLAQLDFNQYGSIFARGLHNVSIHLSLSGAREAALKESKRAMAIYQTLAQRNFTVYAPDLAMTLCNLSLCLAEQGEHVAALAKNQEAMEIYEKLAQENFTVYAPDLALGLNNLSLRLSELGKHAAALAANERAVEIYSNLAQQNFFAYAPDFAACLNNLSCRLADQNKFPAAFTTSQRALDIRERLAQQNPLVYTPDLARSLNNLSLRLTDLAKHTEALAMIQRAVKIREGLAQQNFDAHGPEFANSLYNLSMRLFLHRDRAAALVAGKQAVAIYERLAQQNFAAHGPILATCLNNLSIQLSEAGKRTDALTAIQRAVAIREDLVKQTPLLYTQYLAHSLWVLATQTDDPKSAPMLLARAKYLIQLFAQPGTNNQQTLDGIQESLRKCIGTVTKSICLNRLSLQNYRGFDQIILDFDPNITVLVAENGQGKTAILDACRIALWPFIESFDLARTEHSSQSGIKIDDVHCKKLSSDNWERRLPALISMNAKVGAVADIAWTLLRDSDAANSETKDADDMAWLRSWAKLLQDQIRVPDQPALTLPVFAYYGTGRRWLQPDAQTTSTSAPLPTATASNPNHPTNISKPGIAGCIKAIWKPN